MKQLRIIVRLLILTTQSILSQNLYPNLFDGSVGITDGYGSWGTHSYIREASVEVTDKGVITFYHPDEAASQQPTIFFISGWGRTYESYDKFFKYLTSLGYPVVNIYNYSPGSINTSYQNSLDMMQNAATNHSDWIDTSKVALMGHSYGAGSTIWLGKQIFDENGLNWGSNGRSIMMFAPWLSFLMEDSDLQSYPDNVKLLVLQSYDDFNDGTPPYNTDPRAVRAMYELINIPDEEKDYITVFSDNDVAHQYTYNGTTYSYVANHYASYTDLVSGDDNPYDALDVYLSNRLAHALTDYVFNGEPSGKEVALGNGSASQIAMGIMPDLAVTDYYITNRPESDFRYKCSEDSPGTWGDPDIWKLQNYCEDANGDGVIDSLSYQDFVSDSFVLFPVPSSDYIQIQFVNGTQTIDKIELFDSLGRLINTIDRPSYQIDISKLAIGTYSLKLYSDKGVSIQKFIAN